MLFDQISELWEKGITIFFCGERPGKRRRGCYRSGLMTLAKSSAVKKCWPIWRWNKRAKGGEKKKGKERKGTERTRRKGEKRGIQVILLLEEMDSFIINPLGLISAQRWL